MTMAVVDRSVDVSSGALFIVSAEFRVYLGLSRDRTYVHVVSPRHVEVTDSEGNVVVPVGALACSCKGFVFHGHCYRAEQAIAHEKGHAIEAAWFGRPIAGETELERAATRG